MVALHQRLNLVIDFKSHRRAAGLARRFVYPTVQIHRFLTPTPQDAPHLEQGWLDLDRIAAVEITSEERDYPVESALISGEVRGGAPPILELKPSG